MIGRTGLREGRGKEGKEMEGEERRVRREEEVEGGEMRGWSVVHRREQIIPSVESSDPSINEEHLLKQTRSLRVITERRTFARHQVHLCSPRLHSNYAHVGRSENAGLLVVHDSKLPSDLFEGRGSSLKTRGKITSKRQTRTTPCTSPTKKEE